MTDRDTQPAPAIDVSHLPTYAFGHRSVLWWGTMGLIAIEGTMFAMLIASYFYLHQLVPQWPLSAAPPRLEWGTVNLGIMLASAIPNELAKRAAERLDLTMVRVWLVVCLLLGLAFVLVRVFEFQSLNVRWDGNAYGSLVWILLGFHTVHLLTDEIDSALLTVLMFTGPLDETRFVDVSENSFYWYFVVAAWVPIYAVLYLVPRAH
jgi:cytochrome c oxidase subunit I+III